MYRSLHFYHRRVSSSQNTRVLIRRYLFRLCSSRLWSSSLLSCDGISKRSSQAGIDLKWYVSAYHHSNVHLNWLTCCMNAWMDKSRGLTSGITSGHFHISRNTTRTSRSRASDRKQAAIPITTCLVLFLFQLMLPRLPTGMDARIQMQSCQKSNWTAWWTRVPHGTWILNVIASLCLENIHMGICVDCILKMAVLGTVVPSIGSKWPPSPYPLLVNLDNCRDWIDRDVDWFFLYWVSMLTGFKNRLNRYDHLFHRDDAVYQPDFSLM